MHSNLWFYDQIPRLKSGTVKFLFSLSCRPANSRTIRRIVSGPILLGSWGVSVSGMPIKRFVSLGGNPSQLANDPSYATKIHCDDVKIMCNPFCGIWEQRTKSPIQWNGSGHKHSLKLGLNSRGCWFWVVGFVGVQRISLYCCVHCLSNRVTSIN